MANGAPTLLSQFQQVSNSVVLLVADAKIFAGLAASSPWGLYKGGTPALVADSVLSVEFRREFRVSDYPVEKGGFESYNKVIVPLMVKMTVTRGGTAADRQQFFYALKGLAGSLDTYNVVMPEGYLPNATVEHYEVRRTSEGGISLITADIWLKQVVTNVTTQYSNTASPSGASPEQGGQVSPSSGPTITQVAPGVGGTQ